jgi:hypothetical protein
MTTIVPGQRTALCRPLRHDNHDRRRANQLRTGRWRPMAAAEPGQQMGRGEQSIRGSGHLGPADRKVARDESDV